MGKIQSKPDKNYVSFKNYDSIPIDLSVVVQRENRGWWTHAKIAEKRELNHNNVAHEIHITKTGMLISRKSKHA